MKPFLAAACVLLLAGCTVGGKRSVSAENDRLRREVMELEDRVRRVEGERDELSLRLKAAAAESPGVAAGGASHLPVATSIEIGFASGLDAGGVAVLYIRPRDGLGRFTQVVGTLACEVVELSGDLKGEARMLAATRLSPEMLRDLYRSGLSGTYYEVRIPVQLAAERGASVVLRAELTDGATGATHGAEKIVRVR